MNEFSKLYVESRTDFNDIQHFIAMSELVMMEASAGDFVETLMEKIKKTVEKVRTKISELVMSKKIKDTIKETEDLCKENPDATKSTGKMADYKKLNELNEKTQEAVVNAKSVEEIEAVMKKYRNQRNKLLVATAAITVTLGGILVFLSKNHKKTVDALNNKCAKMEKSLNAAKKHCHMQKENIEELQKKNQKLKDNLILARQKNPIDRTAAKAQMINRDIKKAAKDATNKASDATALLKASAKAQTEIMNNASSDIISSVKDSLNVLGDAKAGVFKKAKAVSSVPGTVINSGAKIVSGQAAKEYGDNRKEEIKSRVRKLQSGIEKAQYLLGSASASASQKEKAKKYIDESNKKIRQLKQEYGKLKRSQL